MNTEQHSGALKETQEFLLLHYIYEGRTTFTGIKKPSKFLLLCDIYDCKTTYTGIQRITLKNETWIKTFN